MPRSRQELQELVSTLGKVCISIGRADLASQLRVYFLALSRGLTDARGTLQLKWSEDAVTDWLGMLQVPPFSERFPVRGENARCSRCHPAPSPRAYQNLETVAQVPGGTGRRCKVCGERWLERAPRN